MPTPKRQPAFQFYPSAWLGSVAVELMPPEVEGTYIRLLARQWVAGCLPVEPDQLRGLTKLTPTQWKKAWPLLEPHFPIGDGGRQNPTLHAVFLEREEFAEQMRANARKGGRPKKPEGLQNETRRLAEKNQKYNQNETSVSVTVSGTGTNSSTSKADDDGVVTAQSPLNAPSAASSAAFQAIAPCVAPVGHDALRLLLATVTEPTSWAGVIRGCASGQSMPEARPASAERLAAAVQDFVAAGHHRAQPAKVKLFRGFVANSSASAPQTRYTPTADDERVEQLRTLREQNERRRMRGEPLKPEPTWAGLMDAAFPDGRTWPAGVAA